MTKGFHARKANSEVERIWPKLWFNLNVYTQFPVYFLALCMATKVVGAQRNHKMVYYILPPCTVQPNHPKKEGSDGAAVLVSWLLSSSALNTFLCPYSHVGPYSVRYLPYILCKSHIFTHYWSLYKFHRLMLVFGARLASISQYWASILSLCSYDGT